MTMNSLSRQSWLTLCRDRVLGSGDFGVATVVLPCGCCLVSQHEIYDATTSDGLTPARARLVSYAPQSAQAGAT